MQSQYPVQFVRDMGCTESEWLKWLHAALPDCGWHQELGHAQGQAQVQVQVQVPLTIERASADHLGLVDPAAHAEQGVLHLSWTTLPARQIALMRIPRLQVEFRFEHLSDQARTQFMRRFDLLTQRGGG